MWRRGQHSASSSADAARDRANANDDAERHGDRVCNDRDHRCTADERDCAERVECACDGRGQTEKMIYAARGGLNAAAAKMQSTGVTTMW